MNLYSMFNTDQKLETTGIWLDYGPNSKGKKMRVLVARAGGSNKAFTKALERETKPYRKALQTGSLSNKLAEDLMKKVIIETVVLGWENIEDREKNDMPFTKENVEKIFRELPEFFNDVRDQANNMAHFREEELEADLGNSGTSSLTDSSKDL